MAEPRPLSSVEEAVTAFRQGRLVVLVDHEERENEGDLAIAAEKVTPEAINFMARFGRGLVCLALTGERCDELDLPPMVPPEENDAPLGTAFTVSIEARGKVTTGISAADRAATILTAVDPVSGPGDLVRPGHVFPLRARPGGVLERAGQTEASVDLARLAGLAPAAAICEVMSEDGSMARLPELRRLAAAHDLPVLRISDLIQYRLEREDQVERVASPRLPTPWGELTAHAFRLRERGEEHLALTRGAVDDGRPVLVRLHSQCLTGDVFASERCDCGLQLRAALTRIAEEGRGVLLYLLQEGRGIGLFNKLRAYELQERGHDTVEANRELGFAPDARSYSSAALILRALGARRVRLMTNNPSKQAALPQYGIEVVERLPLELPAAERARDYLRAKRDKLGHLLRMV